MIKNMGIVDRVIRIAVAILIAVLYYTGQISGTAAIILGIVALAFIATSLVGFCPVYKLFSLSTLKKGK
ncbi:MAG: hypothetical protein A2W19_16595 [Spirochaetes bacterium RBG_16_49_21]|nr:MAG: hypothetical protein A2W19_16595 [Spirochaetes bacterium RBG_16_49_21]